MNHRTTRRFTVAVPVVMAVSVVGAPPASADVPGSGIVKDVLSGASGWAWDSVTGGIASWVLGAVAYFVDGVINFLKTSARPDVTAGWFAGAGSPFATVRNMAAVLLAGFVLLGLLQGLLHGDPAAMVRRMAADLPLAVLGMVATVVVVDKLVELTDALSTAVLSNADSQALRFLSRLGVTTSLGNAGFAAVVVGLVAVAAAFLLWVELMVRSALIYLLVAVSPLAFAAMVWPAARGVLRRTVQLLAAVVLSKLAVAIALAVGVAALGGADQTGGSVPGASTLGAGHALAAGMGTLLVGTTLLCLAAFAPFLVLQLIPLAEGALVAQGVSRGPVRAAQSGLGAYSTTTSLTRLSGDRGTASPGLSGGNTVSSTGVGGGSTAAAAAGPTIAGAAASAAGNTAKRVRSTVERSTTNLAASSQRPEPQPSRPRGSGAPPVPPPGRPTPSKRSES